MSGAGRIHLNPLELRRGARRLRDHGADLDLLGRKLAAERGQLPEMPAGVGMHVAHGIAEASELLRGRLTPLRASASELEWRARWADIAGTPGFSPAGLAALLARGITVFPGTLGGGRGRPLTLARLARARTSSATPDFSSHPGLRLSGRSFTLIPAPSSIRINNPPKQGPLIVITVPGPKGPLILINIPGQKGPLILRDPIPPKRPTIMRDPIPVTLGSDTLHSGRGKPNRHPKTRVPFDKDGFPVFGSQHDFRLPDDLIGPRASDRRQMVAATRDLRATLDENPALRRQFTAEQLAAIEEGKARIPGFTWHHHQDGRHLTLVARDAHAGTGHIGGRAVTGGRR